MKPFPVTRRKRMLAGAAMFLAGVLMMLTAFGAVSSATFIGGLVLAAFGGWAFSDSLEE